MLTSVVSVVRVRVGKAAKTSEDDDTELSCALGTRPTGDWNLEQQARRATVSVVK